MKAYVYNKQQYLIDVIEGKDWDDCVDRVVEKHPHDSIGDFFQRPIWGEKAPPEFRQDQVISVFYAGKVLSLKIGWVCNSKQTVKASYDCPIEKRKCREEFSFDSVRRMAERARQEASES